MHLVLGDRTEQSVPRRGLLALLPQVRDRFLAFVARHPNGDVSERVRLLRVLPVARHLRRALEGRRPPEPGRRHHAHADRAAAGSGTRHARGACRSWPPTTRIAKLRPIPFDKLRSQAALQLARRRTGKPSVELLEPRPDAGAAASTACPQPDAGDVFFDMEGDPFERGGLEYLFGIRFVDGGAARFKAIWAHDRAGEGQAFEALMDFLAERLQRFPACTSITTRTTSRRR